MINIAVNGTPIIISTTVIEPLSSNTKSDSIVRI